MDVLRVIDEIEEMVETGPGWMGKRLVDEEAFFTKIMQLRSALPTEMKRVAEASGDAPPKASGNAPAVSEIIAQTSLLTVQEQLQIVAALARRVADES